jgi:hypothetical protein
MRSEKPEMEIWYRSASYLRRLGQQNLEKGEKTGN